MTSQHRRFDHWWNNPSVRPVKQSFNRSLTESGLCGVCQDKSFSFTPPLPRRNLLFLFHCYFTSLNIPLAWSGGFFKRRMSTGIVCQVRSLFNENYKSWVSMAGSCRTDGPIWCGTGRWRCINTRGRNINMFVADGSLGALEWKHFSFSHSSRRGAQKSDDLRRFINIQTSFFSPRNPSPVYHWSYRGLLLITDPCRTGRTDTSRSIKYTQILKSSSLLLYPTY